MAAAMAEMIIAVIDSCPLPPGSDFLTRVAV